MHTCVSRVVDKSEKRKGVKDERKASRSMGRMSVDTRARVVWLWRAGYSVSNIRKRLLEEDIKVSRKSLYILLKKYQQTSSIADRKKEPRRSVQHFQFVDEALEGNNELTSRQLHSMLIQKFPGLHVSVATVKRARKNLGWSSKKTRYCAMISEVNKEKRVTWCMDRIAEGDLELSNVIFTDESSVQLECHRKIAYQKKGQPVRLAARPKHPPKVHVWGGISARGATSVVIFTGTLIATRYTRILDSALVPFIKKHYPEVHRFQEDNDPKHTSVWARNYFEQQGINWWYTLPSSPDLNPIENVWGSLKQYLRTNVKPKTIEELKIGIREFWHTLTPAVCRKYIQHLKKVIPKVINEDGGPSGY